jgi:hypothetical protein
MLDALTGVADQLRQEFPTVALGELTELIQRCRGDIDTGAPPDCIPELVYRIARVRLAEANAGHAHGGTMTTSGARRYQLVQPTPVQQPLGQHPGDAPADSDRSANDLTEDPPRPSAAAGDDAAAGFPR